MKTLYLNIGNTHIQTVLVDSSGSCVRGMLTTSPAAVKAFPCADVCYAVSVVPEMTSVLRNQVHFLAADDFAGLIDLSLMDCSTLGADRAANAAAAATGNPGIPVLVVDCGTAITFELVDESRRMLGGAISPGRKLMRSALHGGTATLPVLELYNALPPAEPARNTLSALRMGIDYGVTGMVKELISRLTYTFASEYRVIFTGGDGEFFYSALGNNGTLIPDLTLRGLMSAVRKKYCNTVDIK